MKRNAPIGFFDSGVGGLSVLRAINEHLPSENILYLADNKRIPYGDLSPETVSQYVSDGISFLEKKGAKLIVLACHTASAHIIRRKTMVPVIGMVQSSVKALKPFQKKGLAIFGTPGTVKSGVYEYELECAFGCLAPQLFSFPKLVSMIESNWLSVDEMEALIQREIAHKKLDTVLLGCTHYPIISKSFQKVLGKQVTLVDPSEQLALDVKALLEEKNLLNRGTKTEEFYVTETPDLFAKKVERFFGKKITPNLCKI